ncbi:MAG: hypothetical protein HZY76_19205 [Anaerolineae bacterium]|nr:MAG: hypothetical protein HZY76_19205 [Anaerolineae bacterium]
MGVGVSMVAVASGVGVCSVGVGLTATVVLSGVSVASTAVGVAVAVTLSGVADAVAFPVTVGVQVGTVVGRGPEWPLAAAGVGRTTGRRVGGTTMGRRVAAGVAVGCGEA